MIRSWQIYPGRKKSIMMKAFPMWDDDSYYWTYNKKWLKGFLDNKLITNLEYLEGLQLLKGMKSERTK